jgi:RecJ-like exonuclease
MVCEYCKGTGRLGIQQEHCWYCDGTGFQQSKDRDDNKWCPDCGIEFATYEYDGETYCTECLLLKLEKDKQVESWSVQHYMIDGEYFGNDNDNEVEEIAKNIAERLKIKKLEENQ